MTAKLQVTNADEWRYFKQAMINVREVTGFNTSDELFAYLHAKPISIARHNRPNGGICVGLEFENDEDLSLFMLKHWREPYYGPVSVTDELLRGEPDTTGHWWDTSPPKPSISLETVKRWITKPFIGK